MSSAVIRNANHAIVLAWRGDEAPCAVPALVYWGDYHHGLDADWPLAPAVARGHMDAPVPLNIAPDTAAGSLAPALLSAHRDGQGFAHRWEHEQVEVEGASARVCLLDPIAELALELHWRLHACGALTVHSVLRNRGQQTWQIDALHAPVIPLGIELAESLSLGGRWGNEFQQHRHRSDASVVLEHSQGRSGPQQQPTLFAGTPGFCAQHGHVVGMHLAYSGNYHLANHALPSGERALYARIAYLPGECRLEAEQALCSPELIVAQGTGLDAVSQSFHCVLREEILPSWTRTPRPVLSNSWEAVYFDHRQDTLFALVDSAAEVGAERFVLDDGWFSGRRDDTTALGDWYVDQRLYPEGLYPLIEHVQRRGLDFGLWFEPEMISPDSELARAHPDWVLHLAPYPCSVARQQWVLNLDHHDAWEYLRERLCAILDQYDIRYIKWDFNRPHVLPAGPDGRAASAAQVAGLYRLLEVLRARYPQLEIETCASGGGRIDAGILRYTGRAWTSDNNDPAERAAIQHGASLVFPPEMLGAHIGPELAHLTGRACTLSYRLLLALQGQLGIEWDTRLVCETEQPLLKAGIALYQQHRDWVSQARVYRRQHGTRYDCCYVSADQSRALVWVIAQGSTPYATAGVLRVAGLDPNARYEVRNALPEETLRPLADFARELPPWLLAPTELTGAQLGLSHGAGLPLPVMPPQSALLLILHRQDDQ